MPVAIATLPSVLPANKLVPMIPGSIDPFGGLQEALRGRYELLGELGRGGMGIVYLAYEVALERTVALKVLRPNAQEALPRDRFLHEARAAARLSHPNIVPIYAVDQAGEFVYFTMAYVGGETLGERIRTRGPLPVVEVARVLQQVAGAVSYAHEHGVVHRDLTTENILLERGTGRALVMDFGVARVGAEPDAVAAGYLEGTLPFVSPERARGEPGDGRSDIYALGVTAFLAATGELPFDGQTQEEILSKHVFQPAPALPARGRDGDDTLARVVARCLAKNPDARFQTGEELAAALAQAPDLLAETPVPLRAFVSQVRQVSQSSVALSVLGAGGAVVLLDGVWRGEWGVAAGAAGFIGLLVAGPLAVQLPVTRRVLREGYAVDDMLHALRTDLARRREELVFELGSDPDRRGRVARLVAYAGLGLVGLGAAWLAALEPGADIACGCSSRVPPRRSWRE